MNYRPLIVLGLVCAYAFAGNDTEGIGAKEEVLVRFVDVTAAAGVRGLADSGGHAAAAADVNGDGWEDVYVTNCGMRKRRRKLYAQPNPLFVNLLGMKTKRRGTFFEGRAEHAGVQGATSGDDPWWHGAVLADIDHDGDLTSSSARAASTSTIARS